MKKLYLLVLLSMLLMIAMGYETKGDNEIILEEVQPTTVVETTNTTTASTTTTRKTTTTKKTTKKVSTTKQVKKVSSDTYTVVHYGPDCKKCSGITASGYNVKNTIWYNDKEYGKVRIVATSKNIPLYSIIRLNNYGDGNVLAIVLDRGVSGNLIDMLVQSENKARQAGVKKNVSIEILRKGK